LLKLLPLLLIALFSAETSLNDRPLKATTPARVQSIRAALIQRIWGKPWSAVAKEQPVSIDHSYQPQPSDALPAPIENLRSVDRLQAGSAAIQSAVFVFYPVHDVHKAVIVHQGHSCDLNNSGKHPDNPGVLIQKLVANGYTALGMRMPLFQNPATCAASTRVHAAFFDHPPAHGSPIQYFMDPVARTVNYLIKTQHNLEEIDMAGLSGGGWTTTLYAAVDPRIVKSFPVAGTLPLYMRGPHYNHDREQYDPSIYNIAGYKDLYVLGSTGAGREQTQILNRYDDCCFGEKQHTVGGSYLDMIREYKSEIQKLGFANFHVDIDESAHTHQIPEEAIDNIILPALAK
jgi:hypothetical protein